MAVGKTRRTMVRCGCRMSLRIGLLIVMATGCTSLTTAGHGLATSRGDGRHITMGAGCITAIRGPGGRDRCGAEASIVRSGRRRMFRSSGSEVVLASALAGVDGAASAGCRLGPVIASSRGGVDIAGGLEQWALTDSAG